jgi:hypothetical protein
MSGHLYAFFLLLKPDKGVCYGELFHSSRRRRLLVGFSPHLIQAAKCRQVGISFINQRLGRVLPDVLGCLPLPKKNGWPRMQLGRGMVHMAGRVAGGRERKREAEITKNSTLGLSSPPPPLSLEKANLFEGSAIPRAMSLAPAVPTLHVSPPSSLPPSVGLVR